MGDARKRGARRLLLACHSSTPVAASVGSRTSPLCSPAAEAKRRTALHLAAQQGQLEIARQVIAARRLAVSAKDADGWLPIHYAAAAGHADVVAALLAAGSEVEEVAGDGDAPLHKAALGGHLAVVQLLKGRSQVGGGGRSLDGGELLAKHSATNTGLHHPV